MHSLPVLNLETATFDCSFGRGCDGMCCRNGRPPVTPAEAKTIKKLMPRIVDRLLPAARKLVEKAGFLSNRVKAGHKMLRVVDGWCVFFNQGCVLHTLGAEDGESYQYKPSVCALFPLDYDDHHRWYVRQWKYKGEDWDLFCLNPKNTKRKASDSLAAEIALAEKMEQATKRGKKK
jgi:Fe-S-cluster containining protein